MKIAITGAYGNVGSEVVKLCTESGHTPVLIDLAGKDGYETQVVGIATDYDGTVKALRGCDALIHLAAIPNPIGKADTLVHGNNVRASFNGFRAAGEVGIKRICFASSVNAIGLAFANQPLKFEYFPLDEEHPPNPTDAYALAKLEAEVQARAFANWFPGTKIACLRIHAVAPKATVRKSYSEKWDEGAVKELYGWVHPRAVARACLAAVEKADQFEGCEIFNVAAQDTTEEIESRELAKMHYPDAELREGFVRRNSFWTTEKIERMLDWKHVETE